MILPEETKDRLSEEQFYLYDNLRTLVERSTLPKNEVSLVLDTLSNQVGNGLITLVGEDVTEG